MQKYKQRKDGRYKTRVWDGTYVDGQKHYIDVYSTKSSRDLEAKVREIEMKRLDGAIANNKHIDMFDYTIELIERTKASCEPSTRRFYLSCARNTLKSLKGFSFDCFTYNNIQDLFNLQKDHPCNVENMKLILKQVGKAAERDKLIPKGTTSEIFEQIRTPKKKPSNRTVLSDADKKAILEADLSPMENCFIHTLYYTGLRRSEAVALTKDDVKDGFINVNKAIGASADGEYLKVPKSHRGIRKVPIPTALQKEFDEYLPTVTGDLLFSKRGKHLTLNQLATITRRLRRISGVNISLHGFRHNYCTMLCYQSFTKGTITPKKIAELLGDKEDMVMHVYSHIVEEKENVSDAIENALCF